jgi:NAD(P)-dependent dehydrogenase (short-subunit alcohol dehydrogenase family)
MNSNQRCAVVTGGSRGIGLEAARLFIEEGVRVAIISRQQSRLDEARVALGTDLMTISADVAKPDEIAAAMHHVAQRLGPIDILFANAGVSDTPPLGAPSMRNSLGVQVSCPT